MEYSKEQIDAINGLVAAFSKEQLIERFCSPERPIAIDKATTTACNSELQPPKEVTTDPIGWVLRANGGMTRLCYPFYTRYEYEGWLEWYNTYTKKADRARADKIELEIYREKLGNVTYTHTCTNTTYCPLTDKVGFWDNTPFPFPGNSGCGRTSLIVRGHAYGTVISSGKIWIA